MCTKLAHIWRTRRTHPVCTNNFFQSALRIGIFHLARNSSFFLSYFFCENNVHLCLPNATFNLLSQRPHTYTTYAHYTRIPVSLFRRKTIINLDEPHYSLQMILLANSISIFVIFQVSTQDPHYNPMNLD